MKHLFRYYFIILSSLVVLVVTAGCGSDSIPVQPVTGTVTYKGEPLEGANITFIPADGSGRGASALTEPNGTFSLSTPAATKDGAMVGEYNVFVEKSITVVSATGREYIPPQRESNLQPWDPGYDRSIESDNVVTHPRSVIPEKYNNQQMPLLTATVQKGKNVFDFNLED